MKVLSRRHEEIIALALEGWTPSDIALWLGISRQRVEQVLRPDRHAARTQVVAALKAGALKRPAACEKCGAADPLEAHHSDYTKPLDVQWWCHTCHVGQHATERNAAPDAPGGVPCPSCGGVYHAVTDTRTAPGYVRRRRLCQACGARFTTHETAV